MEQSQFSSVPNNAHTPDAVIPPMESKRRGIAARLLHGTGAGVISYGLGIASNLLLLPLYLRFWSVATYGEWMAVYSVVNYLGSLDFGVTTAAINAATIAYAREDWPAFKRIQGTAWAASLAIAGLGGVVVASLTVFYFRVDSWLGLRAFGHQEARLVICALAVSLLANIPGRQLTGIFVATGEFAKSQWLTNIYACISFLATAVALGLGAGPVALAVVLAVATLFTIVFSLILLNHRGARLVPRLWDADWHTARKLAAPTGQIGLSMVASALTVQGPIIVLSRMLGGPAVALFTTTRTVSNVVRATIVLLRAPMRPEFGAASAQSRKDSLRRLFRIAVSIDTIVALSLSAMLWSGGVWLIRFWSRGHILPDPMLLHLLLISVVLEGFLQILTSVGWATNKIRAVSLGLLATAIISVVLAVALVGRFGPSAIPIGALIPLVTIMTPIALHNASSEAHMPLRFVIGRLFLPFVAVVALSAAISFGFEKIEAIPLWLSATMSTLIICLLTVLTSGYVYLNREDRRILYERIVKRLSRKTPGSSAYAMSGEGT